MHQAISLLFLCTMVSVLPAQSYSESSFPNTTFGKQNKTNSFFYLMGEPKTQYSEADTEELHCLSVDYDDHILSMTSRPLNHIPKQIHVIWIGPKPFPEKSIPNMLSWQRNHPEWTMYFWTDHPERAVPVPGMVKRLVQEYDFAGLAPLITQSSSWPEKADMMRYTILYQEGGVYADHDMWCEQSIEPFSDHFDFVAGCDPLQLHPGIKSNVFINNSF
jgi:mannosyltransferase OCH1-like enzyme